MRPAAPPLADPPDPGSPSKVPIPLARAVLSCVNGRARGLCLAVALAACAGRPSPAEVARLNSEARFVYDSGTWKVDGKPPIEVTDVAQFRALLRDPAPKSLVITDAQWTLRERKILCAELDRDDIAVRRLAVRVTDVARPWSEAVECLSRLPVEYLALSAYPSSEYCVPLDLEGLSRKLERLRGLELSGYQIADRPRPLASPWLEALHLRNLSRAGRASWDTDRAAFFDAIAESRLPALRTLTVHSDSPGWTIEQLRPLTRLAQITGLDLDLKADPAAIAMVIAAMPSLRQVSLPYPADDGVASALEAARDLEVLELWGDQMTDRGLASIARVRTLRELVIYGRLSDARLSLLASTRQLRRLSITADDGGVMRDSLEAISRLGQLEALDLARPLDPASVVHLRRLPALRSLALRSPVPCDAAGFLDALNHISRLELRTEPRCLSALRHLTSLEHLVVHHDRDVFRAADIAPIVDLPITTFELPGGGAIDDGAAILLSKMKGLRALQVSTRAMTCRGIRALARSHSLRQFGRDEAGQRYWEGVVDHCRAGTLLR